MHDVRLTIKKRAFPSQGRVRINVANLPDLGINEGGHVDLINEDTKKSVTVTVIADTMVRKGQIRVSEEDLKTIGLNDDDEVLVRKATPPEEKTRKPAAYASRSLSRGAGTLDEKVRKSAGNAKAGAAKAADTVKKERRKAAGIMGKAAAKTVKVVKTPVRKATGPRDVG